MRYRIREKIDRPAPELIDRLGGPRATYLGAWVRGFGTMDPAIQPLHIDWKFIGPAVTVDLDDPDPGIPMLAMDMCEPGDVMVIAARGRMDSLCFGGGMASTGLMQRMAGCIIDGACSDRGFLLQRGFPIAARGATPTHATRYLPGSINIPIVCGGVVVHPGDVVAASADGCVVISKDRLEYVIHEIEEQNKRLAGYSADLRSGLTIGQSVKARERYQANSDITWE